MMWQYIQCPQSLLAEKKKVTELDIRLQSSWYFACITETWGVFFLIWMATWNHCWLEFGDSTFILYLLVCLPEKEEILLWLLSWRVWTHTSIFQEAENVHLEASDHRAKRRSQMKKCNGSLVLRVLLWELSTCVLIPQEQSLFWNQTLFSSVRCLGSWSGQCIYLPLISKLQSVSDGTLALCLSPTDTVGYKVVLVLVLVFLLIMHHHPVSHVPNFCAKVQSLCLAFVRLFFFLICQKWSLLCLYLRKPKQWRTQQYSLKSPWKSVVELEAKVSFQFSDS